MISAANPNYVADELLYQLTTTKARVVICHPDAVDTVLTATRQCGLPADHIILLDRLSQPSPIPFPVVGDLVEEGVGQIKRFNERRLSPGEGKTKLAFLSFSSGTTGRPKVSVSWKNGHRADCGPGGGYTP